MERWKGRQGGKEVEEPFSSQRDPLIPLKVNRGAETRMEGGKDSRRNQTCIYTNWEAVAERLHGYSCNLWECEEYRT